MARKRPFVSELPGRKSVTYHHRSQTEDYAPRGGRSGKSWPQECWVGWEERDEVEGGGGKRALGFNRGPKAPGRDARNAFIRRRRQEAEARPVSKDRLEFKGGGIPCHARGHLSRFSPADRREAEGGKRLREGKRRRRRRLAREGSPRAIKKPPGFCRLEGRRGPPNLQQQQEQGREGVHSPRGAAGAGGRGRCC